MKTLEVKHWKRASLDRDEWSQVLKKAVKPSMILMMMMC
jgi:hypothetical protein